MLRSGAYIFAINLPVASFFKVFNTFDYVFISKSINLSLLKKSIRKKKEKHIYLHNIKIII